MKKLFAILLCSLLFATTPCIAGPHRHGHHKKQEQTHKHRHPHYAIGKNVVKFNGRIIKGASASSFKILRDGYAKDAWHVYFHGRQIKGANPHTFKCKKHGYAEDKRHTYYLGRRL